VVPLYIAPDIGPNYWMSPSVSVDRSNATSVLFLIFIHYRDNVCFLDALKNFHWRTIYVFYSLRNLGATSKWVLLFNTSKGSLGYDNIQPSHEELNTSSSGGGGLNKSA